MWKMKATSAAALLIAIAVVRIASTYTTFSLTTDEPVHIGAGLELLQQHTYTLQPVNPPLPRVILALAPTLGGLKWGLSSDFYRTADETFYHGARGYRTTLVLMRVGNLVFFTLSAIALFIWARREIGDAEALLATFFFTFQPIILGYSGIANHDVPGTAGFAVAMVAFSRWLKTPDMRRAAWVGAAYGFSILCKFSNIPYVPVSCGLMFVAHLFVDARLRRIRTIATILIIPVVAFILIWAGYAFTFGPIHSDGGVSRFSVPAPYFFAGVKQLLAFDRCCFTSYAFERVTSRGWWWYFPAAISLKTTLPFLALFFVGAWFAWRSASSRRVFIDAAVAALGVLLVSLPTSLDLGIRYVLPIYVPLALAVAVGTAAMLRDARIDIRRIAIALIAIEAVVSAAAHPDYFPYFNALAGDEPGRYLVDSNLDWGQDALRLKAEARARHIDRIGLVLPGNVDYEAIGLPRPYMVDQFRPQRGWIAVGEHFYRIQRLGKGWWWLEPYRVWHVGKSIRLYHIPDTDPRFVEGVIEGATERVLLPIAGTTAPLGKWRVDQMIRNTSTKPVPVSLSHCARPECAFDIKPNQPAHVAGSDPIRPFIWVTVAQSDLENLSFTTVVRRVDQYVEGSDIEVPAVRESEFHDNEISIDRVPFNDHQVLNLRVYSTTAGMTGQATARLESGGKVVAEATIPIYATGYYTHGDFVKLFPKVGHCDYTVSIRADRRLWAFITATDVSTGRVAVLVPRNDAP